MTRLRQLVEEALPRFDHGSALDDRKRRWPRVVPEVRTLGEIAAEGAGRPIEVKAGTPVRDPGRAMRKQLEDRARETARKKLQRMQSPTPPRVPREERPNTTALPARRARIQADLSAEQAAQRLGISVPCLRYLERTGFPPRLAKQAARIYGLSDDAVLTEQPAETVAA